MRYVKLEQRNGVAMIIFDRPPANALNEELVNELQATIGQLAVDASVRAVLLTGGGRMFMAGADLNFIDTAQPNEMKRFLTKLQTTYTELEEMRKPTIAAINGYAMGGGCELALACDWRLMTEQARIGLPEVLLGLLPGGGGTQRLTRLIGKTKARDLLLKGVGISAAEARDIGLVDVICPADDLLPKALELAEQLASRATKAIGAIKQCINWGMNMDLRSGLKLEMEQLMGLWGHTNDAKEGVKAFLEKRQARFNGN
ncbi:MAG: enoyl-CoA hydratase/isomerase family protein [Bacillota bacterium]